MPVHVSSTRAHRQEAKIVLYSLWYHHTYVSSTRAHRQEAKIVLYSLWYHHTYVSSIRAHRQEAKIVLYSLRYHHSYRCDDTRGCIVQFWPPDDEHLCSKHVKPWNKLIIKFSASSWLILRCQYEIPIKISRLCQKLKVEFYTHTHTHKHTHTHTHTGAESISPYSSLFLSNKVGKNIFYMNTVSIFTGFNWRRSVTYRISLTLVRTTLYFGF